MSRRKNTAKDFWSRVDIGDDDACWPWLGAISAAGYGNCRYEGKQWSTHRLALHLAGKLIDLLQVRHKCDNKICCNPQHLIPGTHQDNMNDGVVRNLFKRGEDNPASKLSEHDVLLIRGSSSPGPVLAKQFNVSNTMIWKIRTRKEWKHI